MLAWCEREITLTLAQKSEEEASLKIATDKHWSTAPFKRRIRQLEQRTVFLHKVYAAVEAGYVIIPNFAMNIFAIRTDETVPVTQAEWWGQKLSRNMTFTAAAKRLPEGDGEYVSPTVQTEHSVEKVGDTTHHNYVTVDTFSDVNYPIALARPELMQRTAQAMALKLFDEIGVAVDSSRIGGRWRRGDPVIIGRVLNSNRNRPDVSFFLGWYFDPSVL